MNYTMILIAGYLLYSTTALSSQQTPSPKQIPIAHAQFNTLPTELQLHILSYLSPRDLKNICQLCKDQHAKWSTELALWRRHIKKTYPHLTPIEIARHYAALYSPSPLITAYKNEWLNQLKNIIGDIKLHDFIFIDRNTSKPKRNLFILGQNAQGNYSLTLLTIDKDKHKDAGQYHAANLLTQNIGTLVPIGSNKRTSTYTFPNSAAYTHGCFRDLYPKELYIDLKQSNNMTLTYIAHIRLEDMYPEVIIQKVSLTEKTHSPSHKKEVI